MRFRKPTYNKVVALGIPALLVALLIAAAVSVNNVNNAQAQDLGDGIGIGGDLNVDKYPEPYPCNGDEPIPHDAAETIDVEHYAVFDAFWDYNNRRLSNNFCPPGAEHTTEEDEDTGETEIVTTREQSNIDIRKTVFSVTDYNRAEVVDGDSPGAKQISRGTYQFLPASSTEVWWLREDDDNTLAIGFSTGLLEDEHWAAPEGGTSPVQFEFEAIERPGAHGGEKAHFYVFETDNTEPLWNSSETDRHQMEMGTKEYRHFNWVFTHPGVYRIQLQAKAHVKDGAEAELGIVEGGTKTSVAQLYTFHVGHDDDLGASVAPAAQDVAASATSTSFTVTATNGGPDSAHDAEVQIYLPEGLEYVADSSHTGVSYDSGVIAWDLGRLAPTLSSTTPTLTFSASIDRTKATGTVVVRAEIRNVASLDLDPNSANNVAFAAARLSQAHTHPPIFTVAREVEEFANSFEPVGEPVAAFSPEGRRLSYSLSGRGSEKFKVRRNGQILVANDVVLEYEKQWSYWLTLTASDGANSDTILVKIRVINVPAPEVRIWLEDIGPNFDWPVANLMHPSSSSNLIRLDVKVHNLPAGQALTSCTLKSGSATSNGNFDGDHCHIGLPQGSVGPTTYAVTVAWDGGGSVISYTVNWAP